MATIDLTPFGFTPTESLVYGVLLRLGPATGYAVAGAARLARANAYAALDGLVLRGAAQRSPKPERPARYRPTDPTVLLAHLAAGQGAALDRLSNALRDVRRPGDSETGVVTGPRAVANLVQQLVARAQHGIRGTFPADLWRPTLPAWRRAAARATLSIRLAGEGQGLETEGLAAGFVDATTPAVLLIDDTQVFTASESGEEITALWSTHPLIATLARTALRALE
jgi:HTH-type transcriptional regulator, sugar sensing transcriptional regulator